MRKRILLEVLLPSKSLSLFKNHKILGNAFFIPHLGEVIKRYIET